ncbi:hypothetical protein IDH44_04480 [Paenibacillus sp. IB182496]|uniref:DUF2157 domain-containing protein n=1 Tax=Paenibacillus sabuli TaxID=2772509 RepID=A0A927BPP7_9BACL|nr:hypothetical protein [Paenibacillus sabuli]MBD2844436.1 hypothetical protein [Paenibacillus sabuli]
MDAERRKVIVNEIEHWQRSKLLPDQYCDFLLNLYVDDPSKAGGWLGKTTDALQRSSGKAWLLGFGVTSLILLILLYFNDLHPILQIFIVLTSTLLLFVYGVRIRSRSEATGLSLIGASMLILLIGGLHLLRAAGYESWSAAAGWLAFCALLWIGLGCMLRIPLLHLCGWLGAILVYAAMLAAGTESPAWYDVQLFWLPAAFVFAWGSWFFQRWSKPAGAVLLLTSIMLWFMPEVYHALLLPMPDELALQLVIKLSIGGAVMFFLRKKWIAWVV